MPRIMNSIESGHAATRRMGRAAQMNCGATTRTMSPTTANPARTFQFRHMPSRLNVAALFGGAATPDGSVPSSG